MDTDDTDGPAGEGATSDPPSSDASDDAHPVEPQSRTQTRPTTRLDPTDLRPSWPIVVASLEQLADWGLLALRLGTLALIQECVRELAQRDAQLEGVARLRTLVEALAHMPFDLKR